MRFVSFINQKCVITIQDVRQNLASDMVEQFIDQMNAIGCSRDELVQLIHTKWRQKHETN